jgi:HPt (histidine-containing phosphotransfer) domain-containing protein
VPEAPKTRSVDLSVLGDQTGGDARLEREVLGLYLARAPRDFAGLMASATADERRRLAHQIAGAARAVGAGEVARLAAQIEQRPNSPGDTIAVLGRALDEALAFIAAHLAAG